MSCRFLINRTNTFSQIGPSYPPGAHYRCGLKLESEQQRFTMHQILSERGIEGRYVTDNCPVATFGKWEDCPYYTKKTL